MPGTIKRTFGPVALTTTYTTNVYNNTSALIYDVVRYLIVCNKDSSARTFRLYVGATGANAAGTELFFDVSVGVGETKIIPLGSGLKLVSTDFLVGGASAATALTITGVGEQVVV